MQIKGTGLANTCPLLDDASFETLGGSLLCWQPWPSNCCVAVGNRGKPSRNCCQQSFCCNSSAVTALLPTVLLLCSPAAQQLGAVAQPCCCPIVGNCCPTVGSCGTTVLLPNSWGLLPNKGKKRRGSGVPDGEHVAPRRSSIRGKHTVVIYHYSEMIGFLAWVAGREISNRREGFIHVRQERR